MGKEHIHTYKKNTEDTCCSLEQKIDQETAPPVLNEAHGGHDQGDSQNNFSAYLPSVVSSS